MPCEVTLHWLRPLRRKASSNSHNANKGKRHGTGRETSDHTSKYGKAIKRRQQNERRLDEKGLVLERRKYNRIREDSGSEAERKTDFRGLPVAVVESSSSPLDCRVAHRWSGITVVFITGVGTSAGSHDGR